MRRKADESENCSEAIDNLNEDEAKHILHQISNYRELHGKTNRKLVQMEVDGNCIVLDKNTIDSLIDTLGHIA